MQGCPFVERHKCRLWTSTQSRNCPSKRTNKKTHQKQQSKNNKAKTAKQKTHNQNKNQTKTTEKGSQPAMGITCKMTSYVSFREWPKTRIKPKTHQRATLVGDRSNNAPCGNQGSPQPGSPRSQRAAVQA